MNDPFPELGPDRQERGRPGLRLYTSNKQEILSKKLAEVFDRPLASPLTSEVVIVQSRGMERWLSMGLARSRGICANVKFVFPNEFVRELFQSTLPNLPDPLPFDREVLTWKIMRLLPSLLTRPGFETLRAYLGGSPIGLKLFQLSEKIAHTFDQYILFRPEMIFRWERGHEGHWQAVLFRELEKEAGCLHRAGLGRDLVKALSQAPAALNLPERIAVFGISALPRFHIQILAGIAGWIEVHLFLINPCKEYWGDIVTTWEERRIKKRERGVDSEAMHLEKGNSLLASMGTLGREFFDLIMEFDYEEVESFEPPKEDSLLASIQSDILNLREAPHDLDEKRVVRMEDNSIQIHSCHGPMREMEALHDQLLNLFENDPGLSPSDILVMTPDIETYAPYIEAVFDLPHDDGKRIPFTISDQSFRREGEIIDTFLSVLDLHSSRFGVVEVMSILESGPVMRRFSLKEEDLDRIRDWVRDTRIRWGIDGKSRSEQGLPHFEGNSWRAGLQRLLLGYAMPGGEEKMFQGILPYDRLEGESAPVLGRFLEFAEQLFRHVRSLKRRRRPGDWAIMLQTLLDTFFEAGEASEKELLLLRKTVNTLAGLSDPSGAGFDEEIDVKIIQWHLARCLETEGFGSGFMAGGVTFCSMLPMRSIPFKVICLAGMNHEAYPRQHMPIGFDLIARHPRAGDRSRRNDDRYLFLETLLSARKVFYISYVGQSVQDNTPLPPSVLVSELADYITLGFERAEKDAVDPFVTRHRLHPFSPAYFAGEGPLFSYSEEMCLAAQGVLGEPTPPLPFISKGLREPEEDWKRVELEDLCRFFMHPAKYLLGRRLGIYLEERDLILEEREVLELEGLEKYLLEQDMVANTLQGGDPDNFFTAVNALGKLPAGTVGKCVFEVLRERADIFAGKIGPYTRGAALDPVDVGLRIKGFALAGRVENIYSENRIQYRYAVIRPNDRLRSWIYHLVLNSLSISHYPRKSLLLGLCRRGGADEWSIWEYPPIEDSLQILADLLEIYWTGLTRPLHFFPRSSWEYAVGILYKGMSEEDALERAQGIWKGNDYLPGEGGENHYQLCFRDTDPLDREFKDISEKVFAPLMSHQAEK